MNKQPFRTASALSLLAALAGFGTRGPGRQVQARVISSSPVTESNGVIRYDVTYEYAGRQYNTPRQQPARRQHLRSSRAPMASPPLRRWRRSRRWPAGPADMPQQSSSQQQQTAGLEQRRARAGPGGIGRRRAAPAPVYAQPAPVYAPAPVYVQPAHRCTTRPRRTTRRPPMPIRRSASRWASATRAAGAAAAGADRRRGPDGRPASLKSTALPTHPGALASERAFCLPNAGCQASYP